MKLQKIENRLSRLVAMVESWKSSGSVPRIERDIALGQLRELYDTLLDYVDDIETESGNQPIERAEEKKIEERVEEERAEDVMVEPIEDTNDEPSDLGDAFDDALDIDALLGLTEEDSNPEPAAVAEPEPEPEPALIAEEKNVAMPDTKPATVAETKRMGGLFDIEDIPVRSKSRSKIIALYNTPTHSVEPKQEVETAVADDIKPEIEQPVKPADMEASVAPEVVSQVEVVEQSVAPQREVVEPSVAPEQEVAPVRLADVLGSGVTVLGDKMAGDDAPTTPFNRIEDIRKAIGINDKFLMIRDLFGGDVDKYENTINTLNEFEDLDECMIYIVENFRWNPDSEGAKLLVSLIERKLA